MSMEAEISGGTARVGSGTWLASRFQPAAFTGESRQSALKGFFVTDRPYLKSVTLNGDGWFSDSEKPFLTRIAAHGEDAFYAVSGKILLAPFSARSGSKQIRLVPFSPKGAICATVFSKEWVVLSTKSRLCKVSIDSGETLVARPETVAAWSGPMPSGFCPKISVIDMILPFIPASLALRFHGPCTIWFEGASGPIKRSMAR